MTDSTTHDATRRARIAGVCIVAAAAIALAFMLAHPSVGAHDPAGFVEEMARQARAAAIVHGVLIATMYLALLGFLGLTDALGANRHAARAGFIAFALGALAHTAAATINGFVVPALTARYAEDGEAGFQSLHPLLALCREMNFASAVLGVVAMSAAMLFWSLALVRRPGAARLVGATGLVIGAGLLVVTLTNALPMDVHGFTLRILAQSAWWFGAGALLIARPRL